MGKRKHDYLIYYGNLHSHTGLSTGKGTPYEAYEHAKEKGLDFLVITDHLENLYRNKKWERLMEDEEKANVNFEKFLALKGYEVRLKDKVHVNVINTAKLVKIKDLNLVSLVDSINFKDTLLCINHPSYKRININREKKLNEAIRLIEIGNGLLGRQKYYTYEEYYYELLDKGYRYGAVNCQDNHNRNWGDYENLTGVASKSLKKEDIINALSCRRTFSTEVKDLYIKFTLKGRWMGSYIHINKGEKVRFHINAKAKGIKIKEIDLVTNNGIVKDSILVSDSMEVNWKPEVKCYKSSWYVARIIFEDNRKAITSGMFLKIK